MPPIRYVPTELASVSARENGERWTLVFTRLLRHPPERVWTALTDPAELAGWAPFDADGDLGATGEVTLTMAGAGDGEAEEPTRSTVRIADRPRVLEYTWGTDILRWELEAIPVGTRLVLYHTLDDRSWVPKVAAGWHMCLDVAEQLMDGQPIGRIVGEAAKGQGWEQLDEGYAELLDIPGTGQPAEVERSQHEEA